MRLKYHKSYLPVVFHIGIESPRAMSRKLDTKAMSPVITTIILASTILACVLTAYMQMTGVLMAQSQNLEFQQAKRVLTSLADIIENSIYTPGSSGYVKFEYTSTRPNLITTGLTMTLNIFNFDDPDDELTVTIPVNVVEMVGGFLVSTHSEVLLGNSSILATSQLDRLARVQAIQLNGPKMVLDFAKFKVVYTGRLSLYEDGDPNPYNVIEVSVVKVSFGKIRGVESLVAKNIGVDSSYSTCFSPGRLQIRVDGYEIVTDDYSVSRSEVVTSDVFQGFNSTLPTIIYVYIFNVEISMEGL